MYLFETNTALKLFMLFSQMSFDRVHSLPANIQRRILQRIALEIRRQLIVRIPRETRQLSEILRQLFQLVVAQPEGFEMGQLTQGVRQRLQTIARQEQRA